MPPSQLVVWGLSVLALVGLSGLVVESDVAGLSEQAVAWDVAVLVLACDVADVCGEVSAL